jgi:hypothetical protein
MKYFEEVSKCQIRHTQQTTNSGELSAFVKLTVAQLVKRLAALYGTCRFVVMFAKTHHWTLSWVVSRLSPVHSLTAYCHKIHFNVIHLSMPVSPNCCLPFIYLNKNFAWMSHFPRAPYISYWCYTPCFSQPKVKVTLRLSIYRQSVRLDAKSLEDHDQIFFMQLNPCGHSPYVTSFLTRGWVCFLWIFFPSPLSSVRIAHIACYWKFFLMYYIQVLCQPRICKGDHVYLTYLMLQRQLGHLNGRKLDRRQV